MSKDIEAIIKELRVFSTDTDVFAVKGNRVFLLTPDSAAPGEFEELDALPDGAVEVDVGIAYDVEIPALP